MLPNTCPTCGQTLESSTCSRCRDKAVFRIVQREVAQLVVLAAVTIPLFLFTRSVAGKNRALNISVASTWYRLAQQELKSGNPPQAIEFLRKAATNDHDNPEYALAL